MHLGGVKGSSLDFGWVSGVRGLGYVTQESHTVTDKMNSHEIDIIAELFNESGLACDSLNAPQPHFPSQIHKFPSPATYLDDPLSSSSHNLQWHGSGRSRHHSIRPRKHPIRRTQRLKPCLAHKVYASGAPAHGASARNGSSSPSPVAHVQRSMVSSRSCESRQRHAEEPSLMNIGRRRRSRRHCQTALRARLVCLSGRQSWSISCVEPSLDLTSSSMAL